MRGKDVHSFYYLAFHGITPAYAGKSWFIASLTQSLLDHPRICGEKLHCPLQCLGSKGSPPHMRGKDERLQGLDACIRITPAYAGKSNTSTMMWCSHWDHPRICGEKNNCVETGDVQMGSPPHMRGKGRPAPGRSPAALSLIHI